MQAPWHAFGLALLLGATGCASANAGAPPRSPALDYPPPPIQTPDGYVVGADRIPPSDELVQGGRVGSGGFVPSDGPATAEAKPKPRPPQAGQSVKAPEPPCEQIGLEDASGHPQCKSSQTSQSSPTTQ